MMTNPGRDRILNILTYVILVATLCMVIYYALVGFGVDAVNPFPPSASGGFTLPTWTPVPTSPIATWTPTPSPTITPTPGPTDTRTPTLTPSTTPTRMPTFTFPPTNTPTPRVTRSATPFTCDVKYRVPECGVCSGVAGHIEDLDGNPLPGYYVVVQGPVASVNGAKLAGGDPTFNAIYGNEAAWEQIYNPGAYQAMEIRVQMCKPNPDPSKPCTAISNEVIVSLGGYASTSLGYVTCIRNWEDYE
ncbi:MAG: hypothetical protein ACK2US_13435 [Anaerolineae bacterium]|jgi:hypothetical protein